MAFSRGVLYAIALYLCLNFAAIGEGKATPGAEEDKPCDGNNECGPEECCVRLHPDNGTVCKGRGDVGTSCSNVTLEEHTTPVPSCRQDEEVESTTKAYSPPYDQHCPCKQDLLCDFNKIQERSRSEKEDSSGKESAKVEVGTCISPETLKESKK
uniref:Ixodegrin B n=1 Tax=Rhipicephalus appendiculatus TaxID=34631 RepID=A0A131YH92_RHIAP